MSVVAKYRPRSARLRRRSSSSTAISQRASPLRESASFIGCDDVGVAELHDPQIAVVRRDLEAGGANAAQLLLGLIGGAENATDVVLPTEFVPRPSCTPVVN